MIFRSKSLSNLTRVALLFSIDVTLDENISEDRLISEIEILNEDPQVHGILVQLPLPPHKLSARTTGKRMNAN